jgi:hypothetical protein
MAVPGCSVSNEVQVLAAEPALALLLQRGNMSLFGYVN